MNTGGTLTLSGENGIPMPSMRPVPAKGGVVSVRNIVKEYPMNGGTRRVLDDISFDVKSRREDRHSWS